MPKWLIISGILAILATGAAVAWNEVFPSGTWRYRMTVVVETPEGIKTGSAVREVSVARGIEITPESLPNVSLKGEAVAVDLGERGILFALLGNRNHNADYGAGVVAAAFNYRGWTTEEGIKYFRNLRNAKAVLMPSQYPMLVAFSDVNDQATAKPVFADRMNEHFGESVTIREIYIEMTTDSVTWGIEKFIPWLPARKDVGGCFGTQGLCLTGIEFSKGRFSG